MSEFRALLERAASQFSSKQTFARALGITPSRFSRLLRGEFSLEVVNCLRLAKLSGEPASHVLRVAGKRDVAELIEELYGRQALSGAQRAVSDLIGQLDPRDRPLVIEMVERIVAGATRLREATEQTPPRARDHEEAAHGSRAKVAGRKR